MCIIKWMGEQTMCNTHMVECYSAIKRNFKIIRLSERRQSTYHDFIIWGSRKCTNLSWLQTDGCLVMGAWRNLGIIDILSWLWGGFMYVHVRFTNSNNSHVCCLTLSSIKLWKDAERLKIKGGRQCKQYTKTTCWR